MTASKSLSTYLLPAVLLLALACHAVLWLARFGHCFSLHQPLQLETSGYEAESINSIWKSLHGLPVYADPHRIPYAASYFNWLYYAFYSGVAGLTLSTLHLSDDWLPTVTRSITIGIMLLYGVAGWLALRSLDQQADSQQSGGLRWERLAFTATLMLNPLVGYWSITTRPDLTAVMLETFGAAILLRAFSRDPAVAPVRNVEAFAVALCSYGAWSFKQSHLVVALAAFIFLMVRGERRAAFILAGTAAGLAVATLIIASPVMRYLMIFSQKSMPLSLSNAIIMLAKALGKWPMLGLCGALAASRVVHWQRWTQMAKRPETAGVAYLALALAIGLPYTFLIAGKTGSNDNYFILCGGLALMFGYALWRSRQAAPKFGRAAVACMLALSGLTSLSLLFAPQLSAVVGPKISSKIGLNANQVVLQTDEVAGVRRYLANAPHPIYVSDCLYANLPFITGQSDGFVLACAYQCDWERARDPSTLFENGGVQGLIRSAYFGGIEVAADDTEMLALVKSSGRYHLSDTASGKVYFIRDDKR